MSEISPPPAGTITRPGVGIPGAIVVAGALIALAIYFGGKNVGLRPAPVASSPPPAAVPARPTIGAIRPVSAADHVRGLTSARITIIEYSDLECPFCKSFHATMQQLVAAYPNDVRWVYRHFPLEQLHQQAKAEANATECAAEQGKFWELTDKIYAVTPSNDGLNLADLPKLAREVGVANATQFAACLASNQYAARIADDLADAQAAGGSGTPHSVVIGPDGSKQAIYGAQPYAAVKAVIDQLLAKT